MMYNLAVILISIVVPIFILRKEFKKEKNKSILLIYLSFVIGFLTRLLWIEDFPNALNVDEISAGYDAFSILSTGIDRNGNFLPIYLEAWGSGQSALYAYLTIPFIKILGLNVLSIRLPMAIISSISIIFMYKILKQISDEKTTAIGLFFFAITPWHIMKARWGMDCNIFPDIILWAIFFMIKYIKTQKIKYIYISAGLLGLSAYAYATSYFFLPIFVFMLIIYLYVKKQITFKHCLGMLTTIFVISLPLVIYVIINTFNLQTIHFIITIPLLQENRYKQLTSIFDGNLIQNSLTNFMESMKILITQNDTLPWNAISPYGITYIISLPFTLLGIYQNFKEKESSKWIWNLWFITAFLLLFIVEPNINRINIIIFPLIYYTILGITKTLEKIQLTKIAIPLFYVSLLISFQITYYTTDWNNYRTFQGKVENVIKYVDTLEVDKIYFEYAFKEPYIYICFYNQIDPKEFVDTVTYQNGEKTFDSVKSFGKYYFYIPENINSQENVAYVMKKDNEIEIEQDLWDKVYIDDFVVLTKKKG